MKYLKINNSFKRLLILLISIVKKTQAKSTAAKKSASKKAPAKKSVAKE